MLESKIMNITFKAVGLLQIIDTCDKKQGRFWKHYWSFCLKNVFAMMFFKAFFNGTPLKTWVEWWNSQNSYYTTSGFEYYFFYRSPLFMNPFFPNIHTALFCPKWRQVEIFCTFFKDLKALLQISLTKHNYLIRLLPFWM